MSDTRPDGDDPSRLERIAAVCSTALDQWHFLLVGGFATVALVYALLRPSIGMSARASEAVLAVLAAVLLGVVARRTARQADEVPVADERDPGVRPWD